MRWRATNSWLRAVGTAHRLPRYLLAQARQLPGMTWYLPKAPVRSLRASNRPPDSVQARPVMKCVKVDATFAARVGGRGVEASADARTAKPRVSAAKAIERTRTNSLNHVPAQGTRPADSTGTTPARGRPSAALQGTSRRDRTSGNPSLATPRTVAAIEVSRSASPRRPARCIQQALGRTAPHTVANQASRVRNVAFPDSPAADRVAAQVYERAAPLQRKVQVRTAREATATRARGRPAEHRASRHPLAIANRDVPQVVVDRRPAALVPDLDHVRARTIDDPAARRPDLARLTGLRLEIDRAPWVLLAAELWMRTTGQSPGLAGSPRQAERRRTISAGGAGAVVAAARAISVGWTMPTATTATITAGSQSRDRMTRPTQCWGIGSTSDAVDNHRTTQRNRAFVDQVPWPTD